MTRYVDQKFEQYVCNYFLVKQQTSRDRGIEFELSVTDVRRMLARKNCAYSGVALTHSGAGQSQKQTRFSDVTLERKDNTKGYTKENTTAVCHGFNNLKSTFENPSSPASIKHLKKFIKCL